MSSMHSWLIRAYAIGLRSPSGLQWTLRNRRNLARSSGCSLRIHRPFRSVSPVGMRVEASLPNGTTFAVTRQLSAPRLFAKFFRNE